MNKGEILSFKILKDEEVARLNERQKEYYRLALQKYRNRAAFVERLQQLEGVKTPETQAKKLDIKVYKRRPVNKLNLNINAKAKKAQVSVPKARDLQLNFVKHKTAKTRVSVPKIAKKKLQPYFIGKINSPKVKTPKIQLNKIKQTELKHVAAQKVFVPKINNPVIEAASIHVKKLKVNLVKPTITKFSLSAKKVENKKVTIPETNIQRIDLDKVRQYKSERITVSVPKKKVTLKSSEIKPVEKVMVEIPRTSTKKIISKPVCVKNLPVKIPDVKVDNNKFTKPTVKTSKVMIPSANVSQKAKVDIKISKSPKVTVNVPKPVSLQDFALIKPKKKMTTADIKIPVISSNVSDDFKNILRSICVENEK